WKDHLLNMDHLKEGIGLRGYGQRDPLTEYKKEAFDMFQEMMDHLKEVVLEQLFKVRIGGVDLSSERTVAGAPARQTRLRRAHGSKGPGRRGAASRRGSEGGSQRSVPLRLREEVQEVLPSQRCLARPRI